MCIEHGEKTLATFKGGEIRLKVGLLAEETIAIVDRTVYLAHRHQGIVVFLNHMTQTDGLQIALLYPDNLGELLLIMGGFPKGLESRHGHQRGLHLAISHRNIPKLTVMSIKNRVRSDADVFQYSIILLIALLGGDEFLQVLNKVDTFGIGSEVGHHVHRPCHILIRVDHLTVFLPVKLHNAVGAGIDGGTQLQRLEVTVLDIDDGLKTVDIVTIFAHIGKRDRHGSLPEDTRITAVDIAILSVATYLQHVLEVLNLRRQRISAQHIFQQVILERIEFVKLRQRFLCRMTHREVVLVVYHQVRIVQVLQFLELDLILDAYAVASCDDSAMVDVDAAKQNTSLLVALALLTGGLLYSSLACRLFLCLHTLLLQTAIADAHPPH